MNQRVEHGKSRSTLIHVAITNAASDTHHVVVSRKIALVPKVFKTVVDATFFKP